MNRNSTTSFGALHPVLFLGMIYIISFLLAFFVCRTIYYSTHQTESFGKEGIDKPESLAVIK